jgi:NTE family protein
MGRTAFVLGGGGPLGAYQVGMLQALIERDIVADLVVGTSIGAINGAGIAANQTLEGVAELRSVWLSLDEQEMFGGGLFATALNAFRSRTHLYSIEPLRSMLSQWLPERFEDLAIEFQCVAASIERAAEQWFSSGTLVEPILASSSVPGLFPPVEIGDEHYIDGGIVNSIPVRRAFDLGATTIYVLQVGKIERKLNMPRLPWEVALVALEVARRHRFFADMASLPDAVVAHILPTGAVDPPGQRLRQVDPGLAERRFQLAYQATSDYLDGKAGDMRGSVAT